MLSQLPAKALALPALFAVTFAASAALGQADTPSKESCAEAYAAVQELRLDGKLTVAQGKAMYCAQSACPDVVRDACAKWLGELKESLPSVVVTAEGPGGEDISDVKVYVDGELVASELAGRAIPIDPGNHLLRFEHASEPAIEKKIIVAEGVKNRSLRVSFAAATSSAPTPGSAPSEPVVEDADAGGAPIGAFVLVGIGVASVGTFAALAAIGTAEIDDLRDTCGQTHSCSDEQIDPGRTKIIVGDVLLAVGVVATGIGVAWLLGHYLGDDDVAAGWRVDVGPTFGGAASSLTVAF